MTPDQVALSEYAATATDVSAPKMSRYAGQLIAALARSFSGESFSMRSMLDEVASSLLKTNGKPLQSVKPVLTRSLHEIIALGLCSPVSADRWTLTERGAIAALSLRCDDAEELASDALDFDISKMEREPDTSEILATVSSLAARVSELESMLSDAARLEAARLEAAKSEAARLEAARLEAARLEAARLEAARLEAAKSEAARLEAARLEAARLEAARLEAAKSEAASLIRLALLALSSFGLSPRSSCCHYSTIRREGAPVIHSHDCKRESAA